MENRTPRYEEAAPSFPTWKKRLEDAEKNGQRGEEVERFLQVLKAVGSPMIDEDAVHFVYYDPDARRVALTGELTQWGQTGMPLSPLAEFLLHYRGLARSAGTRTGARYSARRGRGVRLSERGHAQHPAGLRLHAAQL